jgi:hypothetical protein
MVIEVILGRLKIREIGDTAERSGKTAPVVGATICYAD